MLCIENESNTPLNTALLNQISDSFTQKEVELIIVDAQAIQVLNAEHRGKDMPTDVLSFPIDDFPHSPLGSIIINFELSQEKAQELHHTVEEEITLLFIHGLLHLLGFDHECDTGEMREKEEALIREYNLPLSLIVRTVEAI